MSKKNLNKVGIGCTTYNRPECLAKWKKQIAKHTLSLKYSFVFSDNKSECLENWLNKKETVISNGNYGVHVYIADDSKERKGVAFRKNECLRALKDCDYVFLFDDDCYPIKDGWIDFFVNSGEDHLLFLSDNLHNPINDFYDFYVKYYRNCGGCFLFMTKEIVENFGAFNEKFEMYGFEHADYSIRILGAHGKYPMLIGTEQYIYSEDYSNPKHLSSISDEEKNKFVKKNWDKFFNEPIKSVYLPL